MLRSPSRPKHLSVRTGSRPHYRFGTARFLPVTTLRWQVTGCYAAFFEVLLMVFLSSPEL
jgi:hypothetical protein